MSKDSAATPSPCPDSSNPDWHTYRTDGNDKAGRKIEKVYALDDCYVIYFHECELFYETQPGSVKGLGSMDAALAGINRLLPETPKNKKSSAYKNKFATLELAGDACEMVFCGERAEGLKILNELQAKLETTEQGKRRLWYQLGTTMVVVSFWVLYLILLQTDKLSDSWQPWMLTAALAMAGGLFSVCLNLSGLSVSVNQRVGFLFSAGATRAVIALLAGVGMLLAMRAQIFAQVAYDGQPPGAGDALVIVEMFFSFLAGFSERFVPNILRNSETPPPRKSDEPPSDSNRTEAQAGR